jgi:hypothetical protein
MGVGTILAFSIAAGALSLALLLLSKIEKLEKRIKDLENK